MDQTFTLGASTPICVTTSVPDDKVEPRAAFWGPGIQVMAENEVAPKPIFGTRIAELVDTIKHW